MRRDTSLARGAPVGFPPGVEPDPEGGYSMRLILHLLPDEEVEEGGYPWEQEGPGLGAESRWADQGGYWLLHVLKGRYINPRSRGSSARTSLVSQRLKAPASWTSTSACGWVPSRSIGVGNTTM